MKPNQASRPLAIGAAVALVLAVVFAGIYFLVWRGPAEMVEKTADTGLKTANGGWNLIKRAGKDIYHALQFEPKVVIGSETVYEPARQAAEVVTASKQFTHTYTYEVAWAGSTKRLELKGEFTAKAGFPLDGLMVMEVSEDGRKVTMRHSEPRLLACELTRLHVLADEDGWWNKIQPDERESAQNELLRQARARALDADLKEKARASLLDRLRPLGEKYGFSAGSQQLP